MSEWQTMETAPRDGTRFLASNGQEVFIARRHDPGGAARNPKHHYETWVGDTGSTFCVHPTHWKPLPEPSPPLYVLAALKTSS